MALRSKDSLMKAALLRNGMSGEGGNSLAWQAMLANYDEIVRSAFEESNGSLPFGRARQTLTSRSAGQFGYDDTYTWTGDDVLHIIEVFYDTYSASDLQEKWEVYDGKLLLDAEDRTIEIEYIRAGQESTWSAPFAEGVQRRLEAVVKEVEQETEEAEFKEQKAEMAFLKAGVKAGKNRSQRRVWKSGGGRLMRRRRTRDHGSS